MRVLLVSANTAESPYPVYPLGMGVVARVLSQAGHVVAQFDFLAADRSLERLEQTLRAFRPELVGISIRNIDNVNVLNEQRYLDSVRQIAATAHAVSSVPVLLGGAGFSIMPEAILDAVGAEYGIVGEAETTVVEFVSGLSRGERPPRLFRSARATPPDAISGAAYDRDIAAYYLKNGTTLGVQTKRGCTHHCVYCPYPVLEGRVFRPRPAAEVADDLERLHQAHPEAFFFFTDSIFNDGDGHYLALLREMKRRSLTVPWTCFIKPGPISDEQVLLMKETGLQAAEIGADAASDTALRGMGKEFSFQDVLDTNRAFTRHGIATANFFMFGGPGETQETVAEGIANVIALSHTVSFMFMGVRVLPGTPMERIALRDGVIRPGQDLLDPVYYFAPGLDQTWLEQTLTAGFKDHRHCFFPPDKFESATKFLRQLGYTGSLWHLLDPDRMRKARVRDRTEA